MINATIMADPYGATTSMVRRSTLNDFTCQNQNGYNSGITTAITAFVIRGY